MYISLKENTSILFYSILFYSTSGFWPRMRARALRAPVFFRFINMQNGELRAPPAHRSFAASYLHPKTFPQARTRAAKGAYIFPLG